MENSTTENPLLAALVLLGLINRPGEQQAIDAKIDRNHNDSAQRDQINDLQRTSDLAGITGKLDMMTLQTAQIAAASAAQLAACCCEMKVQNVKTECAINGLDNKIDSVISGVVCAITTANQASEIKRLQDEVLLNKIHHHPHPRAE